MTNLYYDKTGRPIDVMEWAKLSEDIDYKRIVKETVGEYEISTIWLGVDHGSGGGPPMIFETAVFADTDEETITLRYATLEEAQAGHAEQVAKARKTPLAARRIEFTVPGEMWRRIETARGDTPRAAWIKALIERELTKDGAHAS